MKKVLKLLLIVLLLINIQTLSFATESKKFSIENEGISITLTDEYYDLLEEVKQQIKDNNNETLEKYNLIFYVANSLDENITKQVMIAATENDTTKQTPDLRNFTSNKLENYYNKYISLLKQNYEIKENKLKITNNGNVYIAYKTETEDNEKRVESYSYDTVVNQKLISVNISFVNSQVSWEQVDSIMETVEFQNLNNLRPETDIAAITALVTLVLLIVLIIIKKVVKRTKEIVITEEEKKKYKTFGGFLILYLISIIISVFYRILDLVVLNISERNTINTLLGIQEIVYIVINILILIKLFRKKEENAKKIEKNIFIAAVVNLVLLFLAQCCALSLDAFFANSFYLNIMYYAISSMIYASIWMCYFKLSKRVNEYFKI